MFYVYILKLKNGTIYIGYTKDLKKRIFDHQNGGSKYTKYFRPIELIYYEAYKSEKDARQREIKLNEFKSSYGQLKKRITNSLK